MFYLAVQDTDVTESLKKVAERDIQSKKREEKPSITSLVEDFTSITAALCPQATPSIDNIVVIIIK